MRNLLLTALFVLLLGPVPAWAVGFQWASAPDADNPPLQVAIWYPSRDKLADTDIGPFEMHVAVNGAMSASRHPLIVMSHGTGGMALNSYDTAIALAEAGFIVAAVTHTGDNYRDQAVSFSRRNFADRPRHISRVIDFMLGAWPGHGAVDSKRIGVLGHSAGGATALIAVGGVADLSRVVAFCQTNPQDWGCQHAREHPSAPEDVTVPVTGVDTRIRAIVVAAPALAIAFRPAGLAAVKVPVQLWVGGQDTIVPNAASVRSLLPRGPDYHRAAHAGHFAYLSPCSDLLKRTGSEICTDPAGFDRVAFLRGFQQAVIAFFRQRLQ